jgi:hypothetical protein
MNSILSIQPSRPGIDRALIVRIQLIVVRLLQRAQQYPNTLANNMRNILLGGYFGVQTAVQYITNLRGSHQVPTLEVIWNPHHNRTPEVTNNFPPQSSGRELQPITEQGNFILEPRQQAAGLNEAPASRPKYSRMLTELIGILALSMLPGVLLGAVTGKVGWGITLFAGMGGVLALIRVVYYHYK